MYTKIRRTVMVSQSSAWTACGRSFWIKNLTASPESSWNMGYTDTESEGKYLKKQVWNTIEPLDVFLYAVVARRWRELEELR